jgi:hypothetical protein
MTRVSDPRDLIEQRERSYRPQLPFQPGRMPPPLPTMKAPEPVKTVGEAPAFMSLNELPGSSRAG